MLLSDAEWSSRFIQAMGQQAAEPVQEYTTRIELGVTGGLPRASGIGDCGRKQFYSVTGAPTTDVLSPSGNWNATMGWLGQEYVTQLLRRMGYAVEVPEDRIEVEGVIGVHPDGILTGLDFDEPVLWDSKLRGSYAYKMLTGSPMRAVDPQMYLQMQVGMQAVGAKRTMVTVHPHDLSAVRNDMKRYGWGTHIPEPVATRLFVAADAKAQTLALDRARGILAAKELGLMVRREFNPGSREHAKFPCGFCPYLSACQMADWSYKEEDLITLPPIPAEWSE
jgi:hypothetical protein